MYKKKSNRPLVLDFHVKSTDWVYSSRSMFSSRSNVCLVVSSFLADSSGKKPISGYNCDLCCRYTHASRSTTSRRLHICPSVSAPDTLRRRSFHRLAIFLAPSGFRESTRSAANTDPWPVVTWRGYSTRVTNRRGEGGRGRRVVP